MALTISEGTMQGPSSSRTPLVSVIIPCFNGVEFIGEAIESVLAQTHPRMEVVVIDDGSDDGSSEVIARYPVRCLRGQREGVSAARNRGIRESKGEFIIFLDADDRLLPNAVRSGIESLTEHPRCSMAVGSHNIISHAGKLLRSRKKPLKKRDYYACLLKSNFVECISSAIFRSDCVERRDWFRRGLHAAEDYEFYMELAREHGICCHGEIVAEYRLHHSNASHDSELMLASTMHVVCAQRPYAFTSLKRCYCFSYGLWLWRRKYGRQLTRQLATLRKGDSAARELEPWRLLARTYPTGVLIALALRLLPGDTASTMLGTARDSTLSST